MVFNCKRLSIIFCVLCLFSSLVYCQELTSFPEYRKGSESLQDATDLMWNTRLHVPVSSMARSSYGGTSWSDTEQLLNEAEGIILDLQSDRDAWMDRSLSLEAMNGDLREQLQEARQARKFWVGVGASALTITVVSLVNMMILVN